jgi:hypothetical protein
LKQARLRRLGLNPLDVREGLKIVGLCAVGAVLYGEIQDHSLIRYCPEYFSVFHPDIFATQDPFLLALGWGFVATWWVGLILGVILWACARQGEWPRLTWRQLAPGVIRIFLVTGVVAAATLYAAWAVDFMAPSFLLGPVADYSPTVRAKVSFMLAAYNASYITAFLGGGALCGWTIRHRSKLARGARAG